jgi:tetratricopeptide (TPR) repeat protein
MLLLLLAGCASNQTGIAPIEARLMQKAEPIVRTPPPVAPKPAQQPQTDGVVVKPLEDPASPARAAIALPVPGEAVPLPSDTVTMTGEPGAADMVPAIAGLVAKADQASAEGRHDAARANLERALKISPRDAVLWHRLATVSYAQEDWAQAKTLAERSNSLASAGSPLGARNWMLIGNAESKLGNQSAASAAFDRAGMSAP